MNYPEFDLISHASPRLRKVFEASAKTRTLQKGEVLFSQGDSGDCLFILSSGELLLSVLADDGRRLALDVLIPGAVFGEIALFDPGVRTATVTAKKNSAVTYIKHSALIEALVSERELAGDLFLLMGKRMRSMSIQLADHAFLPLSQLLARKLLYLSPDECRLEMSRSELAEYVGATREGVTKILLKWQHEELIDMGRGWIMILNTQGLRVKGGLE